ncbi:MAG: DNA helicase RecG, partial [Chloroflexi bacterium]|nr:DNA helicase RecG [Chloroflexota bacterium]
MASESSKPGLLGDILRQEQANGFQDSTVIGGLDRFVQRWTEELAPVLGELTSYSILTPVQREKWAVSALEKLSAAPGSGTRSSRGVRVKPPPRRRPASKTRTRLSLDDELTRLRGVQNQTVARLKRLGLETVGDLIYLFPNRHNDFANILKISQLQPGEEQTVLATVWEASQTGTGPRRKSTQAILGDDSGTVRAIWFNQPWMARNLRPGTQVVISGKVNIFRGQPVFESPEYELLTGQDELVHTGRLVPVYPSTERLPQRT